MYISIFSSIAYLWGNLSEVSFRGGVRVWVVSRVRYLLHRHGAPRMHRDSPPRVRVRVRVTVRISVNVSVRVSVRVRVVSVRVRVRVRVRARVRVSMFYLSKEKL